MFSESVFVARQKLFSFSQERLVGFLAETKLRAGRKEVNDDKLFKYLHQELALSPEFLIINLIFISEQERERAREITTGTNVPCFEFDILV
jgi:hypothetical protein